MTFWRVFGMFLEENDLKSFSDEYVRRGVFWGNKKASKKGGFELI